MSESSAQRSRSRAAVTPRLLTRQQAAAYCGVGIETFAMHCPVRAVSLGPGKRLERYDIVALDRWIDRLNNGASTLSKSWLTAFEDEDDGRSH